MAKRKVKRRSTRRSRTKAVHKSRSGRKNKMSLAIIGLILNILILPGLGSLIAGKTKTGIWQIITAIIGIILSLIVIGIPILLAAWIWALMTGIKLIQEAQ